MLQRTLLLFPMMIVMICVTFLTGCSSTSEYNGTYSEKSAEINVYDQYKKWKGTPYLWGGNTLKGVDCSGLIVDFYRKYYQLSLPRTTDALAKKGYKVTDLKPGDLVFFKTGAGTTGLHIGIYYKNGQFLHSGTSTGVTLSSLDNSYWKKRYWQARRLLS